MWDWQSEHVTRRELRDMWRKVARARRDRGDIEGARRAARCAREADKPLRWQCFAGKMHAFGSRCKCPLIVPGYARERDPAHYTAIVRQLNKDYEQRTRSAMER